jgi:hypothetical protein
MTGAMVTLLPVPAGEARWVRLLAVAAFGLVVIGAVLGVVMGEAQGGDGRLTTSDGDTVDVTGDARAAGLTFAPGVAPGDRAWILQAVARSRPEAARLIAEVDGLIVVGTFAAPGSTIGVTRGHDRGFTVDLNIAYLNGERVADRATVVLHELGHVIDFALVPVATNAQLDGQIPRGGPCGEAIDCDRIEERFADTFAKWALNGAVSAVGAGYGIPTPVSIEDWGAPLADLSFRLPT